MVWGGWWGEGSGVIITALGDTNPSDATEPMYDPDPEGIRNSVKDFLIVVPT